MLNIANAAGPSTSHPAQARTVIGPGGWPADIEGMNTALTRAARRLGDRRRHIEALILTDLELALLCDPAPSGQLDTVRHDAADPDPGALGHNASSYQVVTWQV